MGFSPHVVIASWPDLFSRLNHNMLFSEPFSCFFLPEKCKQQAPVSASVWHHLPAVSLKSFSSSLFKEKKKGNFYCYFYFFCVLFLWLWNPIFLREASNEAAIPVPVRSCRIWQCAAIPAVPGWDVCSLLHHQVTQPAFSHCQFPFLTGAGLQGSSTILLLCFPCASLSSGPPAQFSFVCTVDIAGGRAVVRYREWVSAVGEEPSGCLTSHAQLEVSSVTRWCKDVPRSLLPCPTADHHAGALLL